MDADVLIQAGHEGKRRNSGNSTTATTPSHGAAGTTRPEHVMTPIVADAATAVLQQHGVSVVRVGGVFPQVFQVQLGIAIHFDGSGTPCASGPSVGFPEGTPPGSNEPTAHRWKELWGRHFDFRFKPDNFTGNLSGYYGYRFMRTSIAEMLIEVGEISCPEQDAFLQPRLEWIGALIAHFAGQEVGADVPHPGEFGQPLAKPWDADVAAVRAEVAELRELVATMAGGG